MNKVEYKQRVIFELLFIDIVQDIKWKWAAADKNGDVCVYDTEPEIKTSTFESIWTNDSDIIIDGYFECKPLTNN